MDCIYKTYLFYLHVIERPALSSDFHHLWFTVLERTILLNSLLISTTLEWALFFVICDMVGECTSYNYFLLIQFESEALLSFLMGSVWELKGLITDRSLSLKLLVVTFQPISWVFPAIILIILCNFTRLHTSMSWDGGKWMGSSGAYITFELQCFDTLSEH